MSLLNVSFKGIRPAVVALIAAPTFSMAKSAKVNRYNIWIPVVSALVIWLLDFSPYLGNYHCRCGRIFVRTIAPSES